MQSCYTLRFIFFIRLFIYTLFFDFDLGEIFLRCPSKTFRGKSIAIYKTNAKIKKYQNIFRKLRHGSF